MNGLSPALNSNSGGWELAGRAPASTDVSGASSGLGGGPGPLLCVPGCLPARPGPFEGLPGPPYGEVAGRDPGGQLCGAPGPKDGVGGDAGCGASSVELGGPTRLGDPAPGQPPPPSAAFTSGTQIRFGDHVDTGAPTNISFGQALIP